MIILGLDPGIARTGFAVIDTRRPGLLLQCGCLTTAAGRPLSDRLLTLANDLAALLRTHRPQHAAIEEVFFGTNTTTAIATAQARGVLLYLLGRARIPITPLTPLQIKSHLTGYGRASKQQVQAVIAQRLKLSCPPQPDDAADALAAALCAADRLPAHKA